MKKTNQLPLYTKSGKIIVGQTLTQFRIILNMVIIWILIMLYDKFFSNIEISMPLFMIIESLIVLLPFIVSILHLHLTKLGYAVFYENHAKIGTRLIRKKFYYDNIIDIQTKAHSLSKFGGKPDYYSVWISCEKLFVETKVFFYTDDLSHIDKIMEKFQSTNKK